MASARFKLVVNNIWFRRTFRGARVTALTFGVFTAGHLHGYMTYAKDPEKNDREQLLQFLHAHEVNLRLDTGREVKTSLPFIQTILSGRTKRDKLPEDPKEVPAFTHCNTGEIIPIEVSEEWGQCALRMEGVGSRIVKSAREVCELGIKARSFIESDDPDAEKEMRRYVESLDEAERHCFERVADVDLDLSTWQTALRSLNYQWSVIMVGDDSVNAFFSPLLPHSFFVHDGLIKACKNDDELAHVLGHEMSHMICGHVESAIQFSALMSVAQLFVLALLDPTGVLAFGGEMLMYVGSTLGLMTSAYSRLNETQADELGLIIAAKACYDTKKAYLFFTHAKGNPTPTSYFDTHPSDFDRVRDMEAAAAAMHIVTGHSACAPTETAAKSFMAKLGLPL
eukprot:m.214231 g.214231  ORF g.214231 m.214231 type:complete len:396 (+) comp15530_c0_seq4:138-1325(+)